MKIRIKGNSLRMRLSKSDVARITTVGYIEERTQFINNAFIYSLQRVPAGSQLSASFEAGKITMFVPQSLIVDWDVNDIITFDAYMSVGAGEELYLLLEKDFQCLDHTTEDQSDNYLNPNKTC